MMLPPERSRRRWFGAYLSGNGSRFPLRWICASVLVGAGVVFGAEPRGVLVGMADPTIIGAPPGKEGFYVFATGRGLPFCHSTDLVRWRRAGRVFSSAVPSWAVEKVPGTRGIWAPHVERMDDLYHLYYSCSTFGKQRSVIGLVVNRTIDPDDPGYRWEDRGEVIASVPGDSFNAIDPAAFVDTDGKAYLFWGSFWSGIKAIELDRKTGKPLASAKRVDIADRREGPNAIEAPYVVRRDGSYYLFVSFDSCCEGAKSTYRVMVGRSEKVLGPYVDARGRALLQGGGTLVIASDSRWRGPGHNSVLRHDGKEWLVHHTYDMEHLDRHRILQVRPLYWQRNGWPVAGEPLVLTSGMPRKEITARSVTGPWLHSVGYDDGSARRIELLADGKIAAPATEGTWELREHQLTMRWKDPKGAGTVRVDEVIVEPTGGSYIGRSYDHAVVRGRREGA